MKAERLEPLRVLREVPQEEKVLNTFHRDHPCSPDPTPLAPNNLGLPVAAVAFRSSHNPRPRLRLLRE
jgi:hypothetical protein